MKIVVLDNIKGNSLALAWPLCKYFIWRIRTEKYIQETSVNAFV